MESTARGRGMFSLVNSTVATRAGKSGRVWSAGSLSRVDGQGEESAGTCRGPVQVVNRVYTYSRVWQLYHSIQISGVNERVRCWGCTKTDIIIFRHIAT